MFTQAIRGAATRRLRAPAWIGLGIAGALCFSDARAITVGPDSDPNCQFHDVTSAVIAADQSPGLDLVQVSVGTYTGVSTMTIASGDDLIVEGGYANCSAGISSGNSTLDASGAVIHGSLFTHVGSGRLTLRHLVLTHGDAVAGGGVDSEGSGALVLSDVMLLSNTADYGGGLFVVGPTSPHKQVTLIGATFNSNVARNDGGGLYALFADVTFDSALASYFLGNFANGTGSHGDGGGAYLLNSNLHARTHGVPGFPFIGSNIAHGFGGGIYFGATSSQNYELYLENDSATDPLWIDENAAVAGGGVYLDASSSSQINTFAHFRNTIWTGNTASYGAVLHSESNGSGSFGVTTFIHFEQTVSGDDVVPCALGLACNRLEGNLAYQGYIVSAFSGGPGGAAYIDFRRGRMIANDTVSGGGGLIFCSNCQLDADSSLFARNTLSGDLLGVVDGDLRFANGTAANNTVGAGQLFTAVLVPSTVEILHSLLTQENGVSNGYLVGTGIPVTVRDVGVQNVVLTGTNVQNLFDPYVDAAHGDFHILLTSSAVDRWAPSGDPSDPAPTIDLDGGARPYVFNSQNEPYDFGAYEAGTVIDRIFASGFDLHTAD
jgi:hypothetical protein